MHFPGALCDIQAVLISHVEFLSVSHDLACPANVEDTDLTALQEVVGAKILPAVDSLVNGNSLCHRHAAQCHHTVHM